MKTLAITLAFSFVATPLYAACFGSESFQTCSDSSGNNYTVQRYGNSTQMQGYNANTGSNWSQDSYSYGNSVQHHGRDSRGNSWSTNCFNGRCY